MAAGLLKLSKYFYNDDYEEITSNMIKVMKEPALKNPAFNSYWLSAAIKQTYPYYEIGIVGEKTFEKRKEIVKNYFPNIALFGSVEKSTLDILKERFADGKTLIYVCENRVCQLPVEDVNEALNQLEY
jgi:uncharacterized protein YyaL (SSP411 family)